MKRILALLFATITVITLASCGAKSNTKDLTYKDVLDVCCDAINKRDEKIIDDFIYEGFGDEWNDENIIKPIYDFEDENLPLENKVDDYDSYDVGSEDMEDLQDFIFQETNNIIELDKAMEIGMDNKSCMEICLVMIDEKWYILYFDL